MDATLSRV